MEPGPLPPHERSWRHPSELGPRSADPAHPHQRGPGLTLVVTTGTLVVVMIAVLVVATTPRSSNQPSSMTATTMPAFVVTTPVAIVRAEPEARRPPEPTLQLASLVAIPNEIAAAPQIAGTEPEAADDPPTAKQRVMVQTDDVTYHCTWAQVQVATAPFPDGAIVVDLDGALVAHVDDGELVEVAGRSDD
ncbi:MAG: hypothetical protein ABWZ42_08200 [Ilumatobacteraceae bacterium]